MAIDPLIQTQALILGSFIALIWFLEIIDQFLLRGWLNQFGIRPRRLIGLRGILFAPFLHGTWSHLSANTMPLIILGWLVMLRGLNEFAIATTLVWLISGFGVWLVAGSRSLHIGASGIIFGYLGFLLSRSYFDRDLLSAGLSIVVALLYGPVIWGVLPLRRGVSWQGHFFGLIGGILVARYLPILKQSLDHFLNAFYSH